MTNILGYAGIPTPSVYREGLKETLRQREEQARHKEEERENVFLRALHHNAPEKLASATRYIWQRLKDNTPGILAVPLIDLLDSGATLLTWDKVRHHLDIEVYEDGRLEFFYRNRDTGEVWGWEGNVLDPFDEPLLEYFNYFRIVG